MITRERLEQLLKEGATIYEAKYGKIEYVDLSQAKEYLMSKEYIKLKDIKTHFLTRKRYNRLFETKEEAEWHLEFGNIQRTETLSLPSWEELKQKISSNGYGDKIIVNFDNYTFRYKKTKIQVVLEINLDCETLFFKKLTLANYTDACKLAKKLFLGEKSE